ncbi:hypothetical protein [Acinetobacter faecalis]|uniref:hypothetical protein n=1 Tax=Acinetobacter faecalis TaxID=2665161 RepID=UPI002A90F9F9|nr:hypothetical protein [Acinetobacter faecalis]MDY6450715.1 hypothetical protein [Acinetobacter faecalis]
MKKLLLISALLFSGGVWASPNCLQLAEIADDNYTELDALTLYKVSGEKGFRSHFYSAPSKACKISQVFVIPKDTIVAYYSFNNEGQQWLYAVYTNKNNVKTTGWLRKNTLIFAGTTALDD